jgi:hypothetical protein
VRVWQKRPLGAARPDAGLKDETMSVIKSELMDCTCGNNTFITVVELWRHPSQGMTAKPVGYQCAACHQQANLESQGKLADLKRRRQELKELEEEIAELERK